METSHLADFRRRAVDGGGYLDVIQPLTFLTMPRT